MDGVQFFNNSPGNAVAAPVNPKDTPMMYSAAEPWGTLSTDYNNTQGITGAFYNHPSAVMLHPSSPSHHSQAEQEPSSTENKPNFLVVAAMILLFVLLR